MNSMSRLTNENEKLFLKRATISKRNGNGKPYKNENEVVQVYHVKKGKLY
jgi:hypothetical protein